MSQEPNLPLQLPAGLQDRLSAAGVRNEASLEAALAADPALAADLRAHLESHAAAGFMALLAAFAQVQDDAGMLEFWRGVPAELEEPFMEAVAEWIAQAEATGEADAAAHLRSRLDGFRQIHQAAQQAQQMPPTLRAVFAFAQAEDDDAAAALFAQQRHLLQPYEAQELADRLVAQASNDSPVEVRQRLATRAALLRRLRGAVPTPPTPATGDTPTYANQGMQVAGDLYQAERQYDRSAHAEGGGAATVVNNFFVQGLERRWTRPVARGLSRDAAPRSKEMKQIKKELSRRGSVAITGQAPARAQTVAVQGMAGVGKTTLAHLLARELDAAYPDGVIWEQLAPDFTRPEQAQAVLRTWAGYATTFFEQDENVQKQFTFLPEAVRSLLAEHPRLLVVLDNVWSLAAIKPLREALPPGAHLVITTRSQEIARSLGAGWVEVGLLSDAEAAALFKLRLGWRPQQKNPEHAQRHALGLDVALGVLHREGGDLREEWQAVAARLLAAIRSGNIGQLQLPGDLDHNVQVVLMVGYQVLPAAAQERFRRLGAFAPEADFGAAEAAALWGCDEQTARATLIDFANAALVERQGAGGWRQHAILRGFALALLQAEGEHEVAAHAHARAYAAAMRRADDEQRYYELLSALPQLRHAFDWAVANDLELALDIAASSATLQGQFSLAREAGDWSERALAAAQSGRATPVTLARAWGHRATILSELATLPDEDRRQRLYDALAAYDEALRHYRPDTAPLAYAATQNNRATILSELATLPDEDRRQRLYDALAAYDEALRFRRPDTAPLDYAATQNNRANRLSELATLPDEDRRQRLIEALRCAAEAVVLFEQYQQAQYLAIGRRVLDDLRRACGADFAGLWAEAGLGDPPEWLGAEADGNHPSPSIADLLSAFVQVENGEQMVAFWQAVPTAMEEAFIQAVEALISQAEAEGNAEAAAHLRSRLDGFRQIQDGAAQTLSAGEPLLALLQDYQTQLQAANRENPTVAEWQAIIETGEALLAAETEAPSLFNWEALRRQLASDYNTLGNAHDLAGDQAAALAAYQCAIELQPGFAMWQRNRASVLIDLGRLDEARTAIDQARALEPDAPRLADLETALAAAQAP
jgi:hypothetical protein